jgi:tetratricopeptide (TPR) repeat protein
MHKRIIFAGLCLILFAIIIYNFHLYIPYISYIKSSFTYYVKNSFPTKSEKIEPVAYDQITYYYRDPQSSKLLPILESILKHKDVISNSEIIPPLVHFFATAIQKDIGKIEELKTLQKDYSRKPRKVIQKIIEESTHYRHAEVQSSKDLGLLWFEYMATGDTGIIERIIKAINGPKTYYNDLGNPAKMFLIRMPPHHYEIYRMLIKKTDTSTGNEKIVFDEIVNAINDYSFKPADEHRIRGNNYADLKKYKEALKEYNISLSLFPDYARTYCDIAFAYRRGADRGIDFGIKGIKEKIKDSYKRAISIDPEDDIIIDHVGWYYFSLQEYDEAIKCFSKVVENHPKRTQYHRHLAQAYYQKGDMDNAAVHYKYFLEYGREDRYVYGPLIRKYLTESGIPYKEDPNDIALLFEKKRFKDLEKELTSLLRKKARDKEGYSQSYQAYQVLCNNSDIDRFHQKKIDILKEWLVQYPSSHFANACLGKVYINYAWNARGGGYASTVIEESSSLFKERLLTAKEYLEKAYSLNPSDPFSPAYLIIVAMGLGLEREEMEKQFKRAIQADPTDQLAYSTKLNYLMPKWHGSEEEMFSFAREAVKRAPSDSRVPAILTDAHWEMYERLGSMRSYFGNPAVWKEMKEVYLTLSKRFPNSNRIPNWFAKTAYLAGDYDTAREELRMIGNDWLEEAWDNKKSFDEVKKELLGK